MPGVSVEARRAIKDRRVVQTRNVVGVIEGSDPVLKNEYVLVTGHYDHVGQKDQFIYHGADDNASATAAVLAIAEAFRAQPAPPKRSVMFLVFEAEEDGLLGAFHYVANPIVPLDKTVAVLNMDMIGRDEDSPTWNTRAADNVNGVNLIGTLYSPDMRKVVEAENRAIGLKLDYKTDADDREGWFSRSDHYPFAVKGVPIAFFNTGEHPDYHTAERHVGSHQLSEDGKDRQARVSVDAKPREQPVASTIRDRFRHARFEALIDIDQRPVGLEAVMSSSLVTTSFHSRSSGAGWSLRPASLR